MTRAKSVSNSEETAREAASIQPASESVKLDETINKSLSQDSELARCLKNMPATWLDGICRHIGIEKAPQRKEREKQITASLTGSQELVDRMVGELEGASRSLLALMLYKDGWCPLAVLKQDFSGPKGENFNWPEEGTITPAGELISRGLAMAGQCNIRGENEGILLVPADLRLSVQNALEAQRELEDEAIPEAPEPEVQAVSKIDPQPEVQDASIIDLQPEIQDPSSLVSMPASMPAEPALQTSAPYRNKKIGRNEPCPCGSGKKYKRCCGAE